MASTEAAAAAHHYHFDITMTCGGCSGAVNRVLKKTEGLSSYSVNLEAQTADVYTDSVAFDTVLEKIKKTGKTVKGAEADGKGMGV
ncbi:MAG: Cytosolic copper metallochaperone [Alectoria sarmentosa]|nr:MAG: Cytosolic copper metallochaperone [Alectoria sarmentosa]